MYRFFQAGRHGSQVGGRNRRKPSSGTGRARIVIKRARTLTSENSVMPNWCENRLIICGDREELSRFIKEVRGRGPYEHEDVLLQKARINGFEGGEKREYPISFHSLVPKPLAVQEHDVEDSSKWNHRYWGVRSDLDEETGVDNWAEEDGVVDYSFLTAWSTSEAWIEAAAKLFPTLTFTLHYREMGNVVYGILACRGGQRSSVDLESDQDRAGYFIESDLDELISAEELAPEIPVLPETEVQKLLGELRKADSWESVEKVIENSEVEGLTRQDIWILAVRHARVVTDSLMEGFLESDTSPRALFLARRIESPARRRLFSYLSERFFTGKVPEVVSSTLEERLGKDLAGIGALLERELLRKGMLGGESAKAWKDESRNMEWLMTVERLLKDGKVKLLKKERELAHAAVLNSDERWHVGRAMAATMLARSSRATEKMVADVTDWVQEDYTGIANLLVEHPSTTLKAATNLVHPKLSVGGMGILVNRFGHHREVRDLFFEIGPGIAHVLEHLTDKIENNSEAVATLEKVSYPKQWISMAEKLLPRFDLRVNEEAVAKLLRQARPDEKKEIIFLLGKFERSQNTPHKTRGTRAR